MRRRYGSPGWIGVIGSVLIHSLVLQSVLLGARSHPVHRPEVQGPGAILIKSDAAPAENLVLIELPMATMTSKPLLEDLASAGSALKHLKVAMISPDPLPYVEIPQDPVERDPTASDPVDSGDGAERAVLFGRYTAQIDARIERAWHRPRSPVGTGAAISQNASSPPTGAIAAEAEPFRCQVRIIQGRSKVNKVRG